MVDENPPPKEATTADAPSPAPASAPADPPATPAEAASDSQSPETPMAVEDPPATSEQERWLRARFEREHEFTLSLMRLLLEGLTSESRGKRFWRWLIDDYRSERRATADLGQPPNHERRLLHRVLAWLRSQRPVTR